MFRLPTKQDSTGENQEGYCDLKMKNIPNENIHMQVLTDIYLQRYNTYRDI